MTHYELSRYHSVDGVATEQALQRHYSLLTDLTCSSDKNTLVSDVTPPPVYMASSTFTSTHVPYLMLLLVFLVAPARGFDFRRPPTLVGRQATTSTATGSWLPASARPRVTAFYRNYTGAQTVRENVLFLLWFNS